MIPRLLDRLNRLEGATAPLATGKHLVFRVEAPSGVPVGDIVTFLKECGHAIHEDDEVFVMNFGAHVLAEGDAPRDLSSDLLTEEDRSALPIGAKWPSRSQPFTFTLDSPGVRQ